MYDFATGIPHSLTFSRQHDDWSSFSYYATDAAVTVTDDTNANAYAARAYWRPEESGTAVPAKRNQ